MKVQSQSWWFCTSIPGLKKPHNLGETIINEASSFCFFFSHLQFLTLNIELVKWTSVFMAPVDFFILQLFEGRSVFFSTPPQNLVQCLAYNILSNYLLNLNEWTSWKRTCSPTVSKTTIHNKFVKMTSLFIVFETICQNWDFSPPHLLWNVLVSNRKESITNGNSIWLSSLWASSLTLFQTASIEGSIHAAHIRSFLTLSCCQMFIEDLPCAGHCTTFYGRKRKGKKYSPNLSPKLIL